MSALYPFTYTEVQVRLPQRTMEYDDAAGHSVVLLGDVRHPHPPTEVLLPFVRWL